MSIETISFEEYRKRDGLNSHYLIDMQRNPAFAKYRRENDHASDAMIFGGLFHCCIFEPEELLKRYVTVQDDVRRNSKDWKEVEQRNPGKIMVKEEAMRQVTGMRHALRTHKTAREILGSLTAVEQSVFWEQNGQKCKARWDGVAAPRIVDVKTCRNASAHDFARSVYTYGYHIQGAWYVEAAHAHNLAVNEFTIVAVESEAPYGVAVYSLDEGYLDAGRRAIENAIRLHRECTEKNVWPSYPESVQDLLCPAWMVSEEYA